MSKHPCIETDGYAISIDGHQIEGIHHWRCEQTGSDLAEFTITIRTDNYLHMSEGRALVSPSYRPPRGRMIGPPTSPP